MALNEGQQNAYNIAIDENNRLVFINGQNGTGKTFVLAEIIKYLRRDNDIVITAPSHKAKSIIAQELMSHDIYHAEIKTTQSALGFVMQWQKDVAVLKQVRTVDPIDILIIDECSMIQNVFWEVALRTARKIIILGDELQLESVTDKIDLMSIDATKAYLTEQMRLKRKDTVLHNNIMKFRDLVQEIPVQFGSEEDDTFEFVKSRDELITSFLDIGSTSKAIIAFTNEAVDSYNAKIKLLLGAKDFIENGDILFAQSRWSRQPDDSVKTDDVVNNGSVINITKVKNDYSYRVSSRYTIEYVICDITCDGVSYEDVSIVKNLQLFKLAMNDYAECVKRNVAGYGWSEFYRLKKISLEAKHTYAITAHKSQGSTYDYVFYDHADAIRFPKVYNPRTSLVALSRAREKAFVFNVGG